jgi:opacity protein-like surface antigen
MRLTFAGAFSALVLLLFFPSAALAQGALVHGAVSAAIADGETSPAYSGGVTWRFNRAFGLGVELSHLPSLMSDFPHIYCCGRIDDNDTSATVFTTNIRLEVPTTSSRIVPFLVAGGGVAGVTQNYSVIYATAILDPAALRALIPNTIPTILPGPTDIEYTNTNMALTLGGGASFLLSDHFGIDADLRVLHIMGNDSRNIGRFGAGVSYRF